MSAAPGSAATGSGAIRTAVLVGLCVVAVVALAIGSHAWTTSSGSASTAAIPPQITPTLEPSTIWNVGLIDAKTGWVSILDSSGATWLRITEDGGQTWSEPHSLPGAAPQFIDARHGWTMSREGPPRFTIYRTLDGGSTWASATVTTPNTGGPSGSMPAALHFRDAQRGELFVAASLPAATATSTGQSDAWTCQRYSTTDGGASWSGPSSSPCVNGVVFQDSLFGYASDATSAPILYVTTDGGQTWTAGRLPDATSSHGMMPVHLVERRSDGTLRALSEGDLGALVVASSDSGATWSSVGPTQGLAPMPTPAVALSDDHWLAIGAVATSAGGTNALFSFSDGGLTWLQADAFGDPGDEPLQLDFVSSTDGWVVTSVFDCTAYTGTTMRCPLGKSTLYATSDGGVTWQAISTP
jgi:photosystem II stability/assembly factor-like uncharacterized protein